MKPLLIVGSVSVLLALGVAFFLGALPDPPNMIRERIATSMLSHGANRSSFERFLRASGTAWHAGYGYQPGEAFAGFDVASHSPCEVECRSVVQAAFTTWLGLCTVSGDVLSVRYDASGKLKTWNLKEALDGC